MLGLTGLLAGRNPGMDLDAAALELARIEHPGLDPAPWLATLDDLASRLAPRARGQTGMRYVQESNRLLFEEAGFRGNEQDYYDPLNSCLDEVLRRRTGIPITLSIVYMEVARRLGRMVRGIGLPGHFIAAYQEPGFSVLVDPFHGGRLLAPEDCYALAVQAGAPAPGDPALLRPASNREIVVRMLNNLRAIYFRGQNWSKLIRVLDLLVAASPASAEERKQRAAANVNARRFGPARADFERYLALAPDAPDRAEVAGNIRAITEWLAALN